MCSVPLCVSPGQQNLVAVSGADSVLCRESDDDRAVLCDAVTSVPCAPGVGAGGRGAEVV